MPDYGSTERVRKLAVLTYIEPARRKGQRTVTIHSGDLARLSVEKNLLQPNRFPIVCNALRSKRFASENHLILRETNTPASSGQSSTVKFVFELDGPSDAAPENDALGGSFEDLRGLLKTVYKKLGGAEAFHTSERESWER